MAGTIYLNPTKKQKKKKDYVAPKEDTQMTKEKKKKKKKKSSKKGTQEDTEATYKQYSGTTGKLKAENGKLVNEKSSSIELNKPQEDKGIELNQPSEGMQAPDKEGVIDLTQQGQREEFTTGDKVKSLAIGAGIGATLGLGAVAVGAGGVAAGASLLFGSGATATQAAIQSGFAQQAAVTASSYTATAARIATPTVTKVGEIAINAKTMRLTSSIMGKVFSTKAMAFGGAWASSIYLGRWGQAEAPESIMIPIRDLISNAETQEDWDIVDEHLAIAKELSDTTIWEDILLWSPFAAVPGIMTKVTGVAEGLKILEETANNAREETARIDEQGESDFSKERRESDEDSIARKEEYNKKETERYAEIDEKKKLEKEEKDAEDLADAEIMQEVWRLRRAGGAENIARADELEKTAYTN